MTKRYPIDVAISGAVLLGPEIVCDGFLRACKARVQTHVHLDHMHGFDTSKGFHDVVLSRGTRELLCLERNADLPYRSNLHVLQEDYPCSFGDSTVTLLSSEHMLGAVQVQVELRNGLRLGYSSDFYWPLDKVIEVEALLVDSTYGSSTNIRKYSQDECETRFVELVHRLLTRGPVHVFAHRGTLHRALQILSGNVAVPFLGTRRLCRETDVYRSFGYAIHPVLEVDSIEGKEARCRGRFIRFYGTGDRKPVDIGAGATVSLSAYFTGPDDPVLEYSENAYGVALSNHADFNGTLEYIKATGAKFVVTDNSRCGKGYELSCEIQRRLGLEAIPSSNFESHLNYAQIAGAPRG